MFVSHRAAERSSDARQALRRLAHTTRQVEEPLDICTILGDLSHGLASLAQSLHQIGDFHDGPATKPAWMDGDARFGRAASFRDATELHRASQIVDQVTAVIDRAHEVEAGIVHDIHTPLELAPALPARHEPGVSL